MCCYYASIRDVALTCITPDHPGISPSLLHVPLRPEAVVSDVSCQTHFRRCGTMHAQRLAILSESGNEACLHSAKQAMMS